MNGLQKMILRTFGVKEVNATKDSIKLEFSPQGRGLRINEEAFFKNEKAQRQIGAAAKKKV